MVYLRATHVMTNPARLEEGIANFKETFMPGARAMSGYAGAVLMLDRDSGEGYAGTYWSDLASMNAAEQAARDFRRQSSQATGAEVLDVDRFEVVLAERRGATVPSFSRINELYGDPSRADAAIEHLRSNVVPHVSGMEGFISVVAFLNRMTGRTVVTTTWASAEARAASAQAVVGARREAAQAAGAGDVRVQEFEVVVLELKQS